MLFGFELLARFVGEPVEVRFAQVKTWALVYRNGGKFYILSSAGQYGPYSAVESLRCRWEFWWAKVKRGRRWYYVVSGKPYSPPKDLVDWEPTAAGPVWFVKRKGRIWVRAAGNPDWLGPYDTVASFMSHGRLWFFKGKRDGSWFFVNCGKEYGPFDKVEIYPLISWSHLPTSLKEPPKGASLKLERNGESYLFDGVRVFKGKGYTWVTSSHWESRVFENGKWWVISEGKKVEFERASREIKCGNKRLLQRRRPMLDTLVLDKILKSTPRGCFAVKGNEVLWIGDTVFVALKFDFEDIVSLDPLIWKDERGLWIEMPLGRVGPFDRVSKETRRVWKALAGKCVLFVDPSTEEMRPRLDSKTYDGKFWLKTPWGMAGPFDTTGVVCGDCSPTPGITREIWRGWGLRGVGKAWELWAF